MKWFRNPFKRRASPGVDPRVMMQPAFNPDFVKFSEALGPSFWPSCGCFTDDQLKGDMMGRAYDVANVTADVLMHNMTNVNLCIKSGPTVLALIVNRVIAVGAASALHGKFPHRDNLDPEMLAEITDAYADFQKKLGRVSANAMEKLGCTKS